jgi:hypothetical protein
MESKVSDLSFTTVGQVQQSSATHHEASSRRIEIPIRSGLNSIPTHASDRQDIAKNQSILLIRDMYVNLWGPYADNSGMQQKEQQFDLFRLHQARPHLS